jgi:glycoprotein 6-alpha-L-fucosyltransferase
VFYGDTDIAKSAQLNTRYGTQSLKGVLIDIHFLSLSDYLVCTFSSQVKNLLEYLYCKSIFKFRSVVSLMK